MGRPEPEKYSKINLRLSLPKTHHNSQQGGKIPIYGREDEIIILCFTYDGTKFFDNGA